VKRLFYLLGVLLLPLVAYGQITLGGGSSSTGNIDILSPDKPAGTLAYAKNEYATVTNTSTQNLVNYTGSGYVDSLWFATKGANDATQNVINVYYDGSATAAISIPVRNLCMAVYLSQGNTGPSFIGNAAVTWNSPKVNNEVSCQLRLPMPFATGIKIDYVNSSGASLTFWSMVEYQTGVPDTWYKTRYLHIDSFNASSIAANAVETLVNYTGGAGRFVGLYFLEDEVPGSISPFGAPLEGNVNYYVDGSGTPSVQSSGTEDWFSMGFYFGANAVTQFAGGGGQTTQIVGGWTNGTGEIGTTFFSPTASATYSTNGAYRLHLGQKRYFNSGFKLTWNCGDTSQVPFTGTDTLFSTLYYYTQN